MTEVPEHLLRRSKERRAALSGQEPPSDEEKPAPEETPAPEAAEEAPAAAEDTEAVTESKGGVPAHLLERARRRKKALAGEDVGAAPAAAGPATKVKAPPEPTGVGPGGHTQRLLTVVKAGSIQQTRAKPEDKVHTWPHLLVIELAAMLGITAMVTIFSALVKAPLLGLADVNQTPNPSKAPWYFLGLQELLTVWHPMVAGVTVPGIALVLLGMAPYLDKNPSTKPSDRKFAISIYTVYMMFWAVLVIIGSFFRGPGFNFVFPWNDGIFFEL